MESGEGVWEFETESCPGGVEVNSPCKTGLLSKARVLTTELMVARWNDLIGVELLQEASNCFGSVPAECLGK